MNKQNIERLLSYVNGDVRLAMTGDSKTGENKFYIGCAIGSAQMLKYVAMMENRDDIAEQMRTAVNLLYAKLPVKQC